MSSPQHEPTMEEILASIRKIISEDTPETAPAIDAAPALRAHDRCAEHDGQPGRARCIHRLRSNIGSRIDDRCNRCAGTDQIAGGGPAIIGGREHHAGKPQRIDQARRERPVAPGGRAGLLGRCLQFVVAQRPRHRVYTVRLEHAGRTRDLDPEPRRRNSPASGDGRDGRVPDLASGPASFLTASCRCQRALRARCDRRGHSRGADPRVLTSELLLRVRRLLPM